MTTLTPIRSFLGKYYSELLYSAGQDKYRSSMLDSFFDQRFQVQNNKMQMMVDPFTQGLVVHVFGNEILISKELYDHPSVIVTNTAENKDDLMLNTKSFYKPEIFQTIAYLICQNLFKIEIVGELEEPIYFKYSSDYESFFNSVVNIEVNNDISVDIIEEYESHAALNSVINLILNPSSSVNLHTFYQNNISAISMCYRNVHMSDNSIFNHFLFGKGSSNVIDESILKMSDSSSAELLGIINDNNYNFNSIIDINPLSTDFKLFLDYRNIKSKDGRINFHSQDKNYMFSDNIKISLSDIYLENLKSNNILSSLTDFTKDILEKEKLVKKVNLDRFNKNKNRFFQIN